MKELCFYQKFFIQYMWDSIGLQSVLIAKTCMFASCVIDHIKRIVMIIELIIY